MSEGDLDGDLYFVAVMVFFHFRALIRSLRGEVDMINCASLSLHRAQGVLQSCLKQASIEIEVSQHAWFDFQGAQDWRLL